MEVEPTFDLRAVRVGASRLAAPMLETCAISHSGTVRAQNQDAWIIDADLGLIVIADGVGSQGNGSWASLRAVSLVRRYLRHVSAMLELRTDADREMAIDRALQFVNRNMRLAPVADGSKRSGTTIVGLWAPPGGGKNATAFNVGDSSLFRITGADAKKMTRDHSLHQLWVDGGEVGTEPSKRVIVQAMGISPQISPHQVSFPLEIGELYVACTDGLTGSLPIEQIAALASNSPTADEATRNLLSEALANLARDNVTVAVCKVRFV